MASSRSFKDLTVWQRSIELTKETYKLSSVFPKQEDFALTSQLRRAAVSIPSNIAEGSKRGTQKDFVQFLRIASGSAAELETQLIIVQEVYSGTDCKRALDLLDETQRMLAALISKFFLTKNLKLKT